MVNMFKNVFLSILLVFCLCSCGKSSDEVSEEDVLVVCGGKSLSRQEVVANIPRGLSRTDSAAMARKYIDSWIDTHLLSEIGIRNIPDIERIDKMVEEYRNMLIAYEYRRRMLINEMSEFKIPADTLKVYYEQHKTDFVLERPIIRGIYIKISDKAQHLNDLRRWYKSEKQRDIERLEKYGLNGAIHYDYFRDRWIDWSEIEKNIPETFINPNNFVKTHKNFELNKNGFVYLLNITEYREKGDIMPFDFAEKKIREIFVNANRLRLDALLRQDLYREALNSGDLVIYDNNSK